MLILSFSFYLECVKEIGDDRIVLHVYILFDRGIFCDRRGVEDDP